MPIARKKSPPPEIPLTSTADVAFLLLIFFLVAASNAVDRGRPLDLPSTVKTQEKKESKTLEVGLTVKEERDDAGNLKDRIATLTLGGETTDYDKFRDTIAAKLKGVHDPALRVVQVTADSAVEYQTWIKILDDIEAAGGIIAPQLEEEALKTEQAKEGEAAQPGAAPAPANGGGAAK